MEQSAILDHLRSQLPRRLAQLEEWVGINTYSEHAAGVNLLGQKTAQAFAELGFLAEFIPSAHPWAGQHLVLTRRGTSHRCVALVSHLDTVFTSAEERANDFCYRNSGDRIYGPGVNDIKGGTLMALLVLDALQAVAPSEFESITWIVGLNALEERLEDEFSRLLRARLGEQVLAVLVLECGGLRVGEWPVVVARKGRLEFVVEVSGRGAHAGSDFWQGRNAIVDAARLVQDFQAISDVQRERTVNVGWIAGGTETNRVPHLARIKGEMRTFFVEVMNEGEERLRACVERFNAEGGQASLEIVERLPAWPLNPGSETLFAVWEQTGQELGMPVMRELRGGLSDGNLLWQFAPTVDGLGPVGANSHCSESSVDGTKEQEYVLRSTFVPKALLNSLSLLRLLRGSEISGR